MSYSQNKEEEWLLKIFEDKKPGRFLDIGAYDPFELSNTRALYEKGWSGVVIEPSPKACLRLLNEYGIRPNKDKRPEVLVVQAAVGPEAGVHKLNIMDGPVSSTDFQTRLQWCSEYPFLGELWVPTLTMEAVITQFGHFDFVNLDAEGLSVELFFHTVSAWSTTASGW
jgi:FkbM family methyltransferase